MISKLDDLATLVAPYLPPAFGAFIGLRWAKDQTPAQKLTGFVGGFGLGVYCGPVAAELLNLGPRATVGAGILIAVIGMDVMGGILAAAKAFGADPLNSFRDWWKAWRS